MSPLCQQVLCALATAPAHDWTARDIAETIGGRANNMQEHMRSLVSEGLAAAGMTTITYPTRAHDLRTRSVRRRVRTVRITPKGLSEAKEMSP